MHRINPTINSKIVRAFLADKHFMHMKTAVSVLLIALVLICATAPAFADDGGPGTWITCVSDPANADRVAAKNGLFSGVTPGELVFYGVFYLLCFML